MESRFGGVIGVSQVALRPKAVSKVIIVSLEVHKSIYTHFHSWYTTFLRKVHTSSNNICRQRKVHVSSNTQNVHSTMHPIFLSLTWKCSDANCSGIHSTSLLLFQSATTYFYIHSNNADWRISVCFWFSCFCNTFILYGGARYLENIGSLRITDSNNTGHDSGQPWLYFV